MDPRQRRVSEIMQEEVATLAVDEHLDLAEQIMQLGRVRHLPVLDGERVVGVVSQRDLLAASLSRALDFDKRSQRTFLRSVEVQEVMSREVATVGPDATLAEAAARMVEKRIGCLPVVGASDNLLGMVTETDLLKAALLAGDSDEQTVEVSGWTEVSRRLDKELEDLRRVRDRLRVKAHLGKAELRDRWEELEDGFGELERRLRQASRAADEPLRDLEKDARRILADLREGYRKIRQAL